ncbi:MAG TPA: NAD(+) diphosphatase [Porticoccaceae bacterium]|jgi:NAD+ diphosphatase|nr:NAD(+) diphosphatase [Gammaproteobacteria bacterium]HIL59372.1 NAD(+) diphosphatase [Porticoccaceae bacterium]
MNVRNYFPQKNELLDSDKFIVLHKNQVFVRGDNFIWSRAEVNALLGANLELLKIDDGEGSYILLHSQEDITDLIGGESRSLRSLLFAQGDIAFSVVGKASQILDWYNSHRYCGACGAPTMPHEAQRAVVCESCKAQYFPRINPCAIMLVVRGNEILLARSARFKGGFFSCLAGFIEVGETAEDTVLREVKEEVGIEVQNIQYIKSQSWPFPSQLMLGYLAEYKSGEIVPEPGEIEEVGWYDINNLPNIPAPGISVAGELIQLYVNHMNSMNT